MHQLNRWANLHIARQLSSQSTKVAGSGAVTAADLKREPSHVFGTLSQTGSKELSRKIKENAQIDDSSGYDKLEFDLDPRKNHFYYKYEISKYARMGPLGLRRALELFHEMKAKARLTPNIHNFSPLIYGCAKAGFTKRAFEIYDECLKYSGKPSNSIVTCLINSCAESPFPEYGLQRLEWFLKHIKVRFNRTMNEIQYNSAIKAYGKLGRLDEASRLVQEMLDNNIYPTIDSFNMLLVGCASNQKSGCSLALRVFKRIKMYEIRPNIITYRLLLRCIRDCDMGSPKLLAETIDELPAVAGLDQRIEYQERMMKRTEAKKRPKTTFAWAPLITDMGKSFAEAVNDLQPNEVTKGGEIDSKIKHNPCPQARLSANSSQPSHKEVSQLVPIYEAKGEMLPNLLSTDHLTLLSRIESIDFNKLKSGTDRLLLFGGVHGYLATMMEDSCKPDYKTFSLMLDCLEPTRDNYMEYYKLAKQMNIKRDLVFYDLLIKSICIRMSAGYRLELALYFVEQMHLDQLRPNISTFESLAAGCDNWQQASKLIMDVENCGFIVSDVMLARFFDSALTRSKFAYLIELIKHSMKTQFCPKRKLIDRLESLRLYANEQILKQEKGLPDVRGHWPTKKIQEFDEFRLLMGVWLKKVDLREDDHPWQQYQVEHGSKNENFMRYAKLMNAADYSKRDAIKKGEKLGNLYEKSRELVMAR